MKIYYKKTSVIDHQATGESVRADREKNNASLRSVAKLSGISAPYLSDLERGRRNWTEDLFRSVQKSILEGKG